MSTFEFITILLSIVIGLGITRLLTGIGRVMELRASIRIYWSTFLFCCHMQPFSTSRHP